ncbi:60s ribosomal protein l37a-like [Lynx pardinus]|uniref:60s ribosomal protein l37a-like n=1 Tax=Lynx pardinus TaxID=191816 RepID=A0A485MVC5_LYNPA|nr:60s ribosomal protein l37a-like [Lynx pardinus]
MAREVEISQHTEYTRSFCGTTKMEDELWGCGCGSCMRTAARGSWPYNTACSVTVKSAIRLKDLKDQ